MDEEVSPQSTGFLMIGDFLLFHLMFGLHVLKCSGKGLHSFDLYIYVCVCVYALEMAID